MLSSQRFFLSPASDVTHVEPFCMRLYSTAFPFLHVFLFLLRLMICLTLPAQNVLLSKHIVCTYSMYVYVGMYIYMCVCICMCVCMSPGSTPVRSRPH